MKQTIALIAVLLGSIVFFFVGAALFVEGIALFDGCSFHEAAAYEGMRLLYVLWFFVTICVAVVAGVETHTLQ